MSRLRLKEILDAPVAGGWFGNAVQRVGDAAGRSARGTRVQRDHNRCGQAAGAKHRLRLADQVDRTRDLWCRWRRVRHIHLRNQLAKILFEDLKLPITKKTKTGPSTDVDVLEDLAKQHVLPAKIIEYRQFTKLQSTYVEALP